AKPDDRAASSHGLGRHAAHRLVERAHQNGVRLEVDWPWICDVAPEFDAVANAKLICHSLTSFNVCRVAAPDKDQTRAWTALDHQSQRPNCALLPLTRANLADQRKREASITSRSRSRSRPRLS